MMASIAQVKAKAEARERSSKWPWQGKANIQMLCYYFCASVAHR